MAVTRKAASPPQPGIDQGGSVGPLPYAVNTLIGRNTEVMQIAERLRSPSVRLMTLIGPGGIGKSRLALEIAHDIESEFDDGAHLIRLAPVSDPEVVPLLLFRALGMRSQFADDRDWWTIRDRHCLLLIDNFEQVLSAAPWLVDVLSQCPRVKMLVTSRVALNVSGEHEYPVQPLTTVPEDGEVSAGMAQHIDAVQLFVERAIAVRPGFELTSDNTEAIARITRQLDGLPLAIELAAAQCKHLSVQAILHRLSTSIDGLRGGPVDRPPHQRSLRDTITWSYELLDPEAQRTFRLLSVFAGGVMPDAAACVCRNEEPAQDDATHVDEESMLMSCMALADQSLLVRTRDVSGTPRFSMLATIRGFGQSQAHQHGEWETAQQRHAEWYLGLATNALVAMKGPSRSFWLDRLQLEHANLRMALDWFHQRGEVLAFAKLVNNLKDFWLMRSHVGEAARWLDLVLEKDDSEVISPLLRASLLNAAAWIALRQGRIDAFRDFAERSLVAARASENRLQIASSLRLMGEVEDRSTNYATAAHLVREANQIYREAGDLAGVADSLASLGGLALDSSEYDRAVEHFNEGIEVARHTGDTHLESRVTSALSVTLLVKGDTAEAMAASERSLTGYLTTGDVRGIAIARDHIGQCARAMGDPVRAWENHQESLAGRWAFGEARGLIVWLESVGELLVSCGELNAAATVLGGADHLRNEGDLPLHNHERAGRQWITERFAARLSPSDESAASARGSVMNLRELVDFAWIEADRTIMAWTVRKQDGNNPFATYGLTPREQEIAVLLTERLSDREIADRLFISPRTTNSHVTMILKKLGVQSRREVARLAR